MSLFFSKSWATHNRAGEITYTWIKGYTYNVTVTTYTRASSPADRCQLTIYFGDGDSCVANRNNGISDPYGTCYPYGCTQGVVIGPDIRQNTYTCEHTYPGPGNYWISMEDPNRNANIDNISNSVNIVFYIHSLLVINPFLGSGHNNSAVLLNPPIDNGCINKCYYSSPAAYDVDGDSLAFKLVACLGPSGTVVPGFSLPPSTGAPISINSTTGELTWCSPPPPPNSDTSQYPINVVSEYNIAIWIEEWRNGYLVGGVERDMQINLYNCQDDPPIISPLKDTCVIAGQKISFIVEARDPDDKYNITLAAGGGPLSPFIALPPATFPTVTGFEMVNSQFNWVTQCSHIRQQPYNVTFKAINSFTNSTPPKYYTPLATYSTMNITVVPPSPYQITANHSGTSIVLNWKDSTCGSISGYEIYRKDSCAPLVIGNCIKGVPNGLSGYNNIGFTRSLQFTDNNNGAGLVRGTNYSYVVVALYNDGSESFASTNACEHLVNDVPIITNASVLQTDVLKGKIQINWLHPKANALSLDTIANPGPYKYNILRSLIGQQNFNLLDSIVSTSYSALKINNDSTYIDSNLNTASTNYVYRIDFYSAGKYLASSNTASSIFLNITPLIAGNALQLSWNCTVPWINQKYVIYRYNNLNQLYQAIDTTAAKTYTDSNLTNLNQYCYEVKSIGAYSDTSILHPLFNLSQQACGIPSDKQPPCPPQLTVTPDCNSLKDYLEWTNPNHNPLNCGLDVGSLFNKNYLTYNIYFAPTTTAPLQLLTPIYNVDDTAKTYDFPNSIAGCYAITALDTFKNESVYSNLVCVDNCPNYQLPNVFTPNGDGHNDYFIPFPYKFIQKIDLQIFNLWGELVFETHDPMIHWNGTNKDTKNPCSDGTFFYTCTVYEIHVDGIHTNYLKGFFELLNSKGDPGTH